MVRKQLAAISLSAALLIATTAVAQRQASPQQPAQQLPPFAQVEAFVLSQFQPSRDFHEGDLITKSDVQPVLAGLASVGWQLRQPEMIMERVLADDDFLVEQLRSPKGKRLYDRVSRLPGAIDHLDRIREMRGGEKTLEVFVQKTPNNYETVETITTTKRGRRFAADVAKFKDGRDFNKPTGRIYRVEELIPALQEVYQWEQSLLDQGL